MTTERTTATTSTTSEPSSAPKRPGLVFVILSVMFVGVNLRPAITSVGFVLPEIRSDLALGAAAAGMLTTVPLLAFVFFSMQAPGWGRRFGLARLIFASLLLLAVGFAVRMIPHAAAMFVGMAVIGLAITIGNVLLPAYIKARYPDRAGPLMGAYTVSLSLGPALAAAGTLPIARATGSWQLALLSWAILLLVAVPMWLPHLRRVRRPVLKSAPHRAAALRSLWANPLAWSVTIYFAVMSVLFYSINSWLPSILADRGSTLELGSTILSVVNFTAIPFTLVVSLLANRTYSQVWATVTGSVGFGIGLFGIIYAPTDTWLIWALIFGAGLGCSTGVAFSLAVLRTRTPAGTAALGGMSQTAAYTFSSLGPVGAGALRDLTGTWDVVIWVFLTIIFIQAVAGVHAGRHRFVDEPAPEPAGGLATPR